VKYRQISSSRSGSSKSVGTVEEFLGENVPLFEATVSQLRCHRQRCIHVGQGGSRIGVLVLFVPAQEHEDARRDALSDIQAGQTGTLQPDRILVQCAAVQDGSICDSQQKKAVR
jgi:hypothetical protein